MTEFVKGQWYQNKNTKQYFQCMTDAARGDNYLRLRLAGSESCFVKDHMDITIYAPASLTPDFSNAKEGDECFSVEEGVCEIMQSKSDKLIAAMNEDGGWDAFTKEGKLEPESKHPLLFNSFAQFQAYWAERALEMGGSCDR